MIKSRLAFVIGCLMAVMSVNGQEKLFEGELLVENYVHLPPSVAKEFPAESGFHQYRWIMKGSKFHQIDETTGEHFISDSKTKESISFIPAIKLARDNSLMSSTKDVESFYNNIAKNTVSLKEETKDILGHQCALYEGQVVRKTETNETDYHIETISTDDVKLYLSNLPKCAYSYFLEKNWGIELNGLPLKFAYKTTISTKQYSTYKKIQKRLNKLNGSTSTYSEYDVVKITPRVVNDDEFEIPKGYDVITSIYDKGLTSYLKEKGKMRGGDASLKTTGVHYKADGEWDF